MIWYNK